MSNKKTAPKKTCGGPLGFRSLGGMRVYTVVDGSEVYEARCLTCGRPSTVTNAKICRCQLPPVRKVKETTP